MHSTIWWIVSGLLFLGVYSVLEFVYRYRVTSRGKKKIPTQLPLPLIGNALHFLKDRSSSGFTKAFGSYLPSCSISAAWFGPKLMVMVAEPRAAQSLMVKGIASKKADDIYSAYDIAANGVFVTRDLKKWASMRKPLDKMLQPKWVETWIEIFNRNAHSFCEAIENDREELILSMRTFEYTMANLAETLLGLQKLESFMQFLPTMWKDAEHVIAMMMKRIFDITIKPTVLFKMSRLHSEFKQAQRRMMSIFSQFLNARDALLKEKNLDFNEEECFSDLIILRAKHFSYDDEETFKIAVDFIVAGAHTSSTVIASAILFLAMFPEYQKTLYEEIRTVFGQSTGAPTEEQLNRMHYLEMVVKETLRHAGPPGVGRHLEKEVELDGYVIPKNSILLFNIILLNYNPKYWERPKEFYPEHFTPEAEAERPKGAYLPFSLGARNCPGKLFATISIKVALIKAVQQFEFSTHLRFEDVEYNFGVLRCPSLFDVVAKRRTPINK